jgi:hypothetical protein
MEKQSLKPDEYEKADKEQEEVGREEKELNLEEIKTKEGEEIVYKLKDLKVGNSETDFNKLFPEKNKKIGFGGRGYENFSLVAEYGNEDLDFSIGLYDSDYYDGMGHAMIYSNGVYISRKDGTYSHGFKRDWRKSSFTDPSIVGIDNVKVVNNKVYAECKLSDGSKESIEVGREKLNPIYRVYRNNASYKSFFYTEEALGGYARLHGEYNIAGDCIIERGKDIVESDEIKSIPDDAIVITDKAAIDSLPSLKNKRIVRIDNILENNSDSISFLEVLKKFNKEPRQINILRSHVASHISESSQGDILRDNSDPKEVEKKYIEYLKIELLKAHKKLFGRRDYYEAPNIIIFDDADKLKEDNEPDSLNVVDRHAYETKAGGELYESDNVIKLPLYENDVNDSVAKVGISRLREQIDKFDPINDFPKDLDGAVVALLSMFSRGSAKGFDALYCLNDNISVFNFSRKDLIKKVLNLIENKSELPSSLAESNVKESELMYCLLTTLSYSEKNDFDNEVAERLKKGYSHNRYADKYISFGDI